MSKGPKKNNIKFLGLDRLMKKMGAIEKPLSLGDVRNIEIKPITLELDIKKALAEFQIGDNGILYKHGRPWILYIQGSRATIDTLENDPKNGDDVPAYHITGCCQTIEGMKKRNRYDRYVFDPNINEKFSVYGYKKKKLFGFGGEGELKLVKDVELGVCIHCLKYVNYEEVNGNYYSKSKLDWKEEFDVENWFEENVQEKFIKPKFSADNYPNPTYDNKYYFICGKLKNERNWICQNCNLDCSNQFHKRLIHCDHIDGNSGNNNYANLRILCIDCHRYLGQNKIVGSKNDFEECIKLKEKQNIKIFSSAL
jgi:hypothetical protein